MNDNYKIKLIGEQIEGYSIEERIWQGATSTIYKGLCKSGIFGDIVAIKILHPYRKDIYQIKTFKREFKILKKMRHPNILKVYKIGKKNGLYYIIMEYISGKSLRLMLNNLEIFPDKILYILIKVGEGIKYIHSKKVVHNDIKPENIIVGNDLKEIKIIDFGFAEKISFLKKKRSLIGGTEKYIAPERKKGIIDLRSDIYSYGVLLEEYLSSYNFYEEIYPVIFLAKSDDPSKRPSIDEIIKNLKKIYENWNNK
ncbi:MAG: serine/threonine protein kinase [Candidatus Omnitrophica bacterium]|nr:serine/threonine protein kinase [Candidatus Omnitrophota bacterium]